MARPSADPEQENLKHRTPIGPSSTPNGFADLDPTGNETMDAFLEELVTLRPVRSMDLLRVREILNGGKKALSEKYHPKPSDRTDKQWARFKRLLTHINLARPNQRCWRDAVYSGGAERQISKNPHQDLVQEWLDSPLYEQTVDSWISQAVAYGVCAAVSCWDPDQGTTGATLYDPLHTYIWTDPLNIYKVVAVAEVTKDMIRYVHLEGEGYITKEEHVHVARSFTVLPVVLAYGEDTRPEGDVYGRSLILDAVEYSIAATELVFNIRILQKLQTRSLLLLIGDEDELEGSADGWGPEKVLKLKRNPSAEDPPDARFITPDPKIEETIKILKTFIGLLAVSSGVPADVLDPTLTGAAEKAEAARIRAIPLVHRAKKMAPFWRANEQNLILMATYRAEIETKRRPARFVDLKKKVQTNVTIRQAIIPQSENEALQNLILKLANGLILHKDAAKEVYPDAPPEKIAEVETLIGKVVEMGLGRNANQPKPGERTSDPKPGEP